MLQNTRVTNFTVVELLRESQQGVKLPLAHPYQSLSDLFRGYRDILIFSGGIERDQ